MRPSGVTGPNPRGTIGNNSIAELSNESDDNAKADGDILSFKNFLDKQGVPRTSKHSNKTDNYRSQGTG